MIAVKDLKYFDDFTRFICDVCDDDRKEHFIRNSDLTTFKDDTGHWHSGYYKRTGSKTGMFVKVEIVNE